MTRIDPRARRYMRDRPDVYEAIKDELQGVLDRREGSISGEELKRRLRLRPGPRTVKTIGGREIVRETLAFNHNHFPAFHARLTEEFPLLALAWHRKEEPEQTEAEQQPTMPRAERRRQHMDPLLHALRDAKVNDLLNCVAHQLPEAETEGDVSYRAYVLDLATECRNYAERIIAICTDPEAERAARSA